MSTSLYRELAELPVYGSATFLNDDDNALRKGSVRDHTRNVKRGLSRTLVVTPSAVHATPAESGSDVLLSASSPTGELLAYIRESDVGGSKKRFVEVWKGSKLAAIKEVTKFHGDFYTDDLFGSLSFSPSETALVYTAEANPPTSTDVEKFRYVPSLGERLQTRRRPTLFVMQWTNNRDATIATLQPSLTPSDSVLFGQAIFSADETLIARGYEQTADGRRLGVMGCTNRPSAIWKLNLPRGASASLRGSFDHSGQAYPPPGERKDSEDTTLIVDCTRLSAATTSARCPRLLRSGSDAQQAKIVWLANKVGGPHAGCSSLHSLDMITGMHKEVVPIVDEPKADGAFPGLFADYIDQRPFLGSKVAIHAVWGSRRTVLLVTLEGPNAGEVKELTPRENEDDVSSWGLLGTDGHKRLICARHTPVTIPQLLLGVLDDAGDVTWRVLEQVAETPAFLKSLTASIIRIPEHHPLETIVIRRKDTKKAPCITMPHGGPHFITTTEFLPYWAAFAAEGYVVSLVNYTGSLGHGQHFIEKLIGRAGELDVEECMASAKHLIELGVTEPGPGKQFIIGGSHGGFLGAHLVGRYPDFFSAVSLRNPVVAAGDMVNVTDIPDWCFAQFGQSVTPASAGHVATPDEYQHMQAASPMAHVGNIKAPVLLLIGDADARVPMSQGKALYHALKARKGEVEVEMLLFPGQGHALDGVEADRVAWDTTREWFAKVVKM